MHSLLVRLLCCAVVAASLVSCVDVPSYPAYGGGYHNGGYGYNEGYNNYNHGYSSYNQGYNQGYVAGSSSSHNNHQQQQQHHDVHCYCSHKSCGCKPGRPKGGCYCDDGQHRH